MFLPSKIIFILWLKNVSAADGSSDPIDKIVTKDDHNMQSSITYFLKGQYPRIIGLKYGVKQQIMFIICQ